MADIKLRGHHLQALNMFLIYGEKSVDFSQEYGQEFNDRAIALLKQIVDNPELEVEIINTLDDICNLDCPRLNPECSYLIHHIGDERFAFKYGFEIGETYTSREIVKTLIESRFPEFEL